jgi:hypothetical protein
VCKVLPDGTQRACDQVVWAATRLEKTLRRDELEAILTSSGIDVDSSVVKWELADAREPGDLVIVDVGDRNSILTKVRACLGFHRRFCGQLLSVSISNVTICCKNSLQSPRFFVIRCPPRST